MARERERPVVIAQGVAAFERHTLPQGMQVAARARIVEDFARVVEVILPQKEALRADGTLHDRADLALRRQPQDDMARLRPRTNRQTDRLAPDGFAGHFRILPPAFRRDGQAARAAKA